MLRSLIFLSLTSFLFGAADAQSFDKAKLDSYFDRLIEKNKAMGSFVIASNGHPLYQRAIGYSSISDTSKTPLTSSSRFRIGSITKMYTAVMVLQLVEEKKLKLTDTLAKFFPQVANAGKITIAQLLSHRSGLHDALIDKNLRPTSKSTPISKNELVDIISKGTPDFEPGTKHAYSNSGYTLLGLIIEKISGRSYEQVLKQKITGKLGLKNTYAAKDTIDVAANESLTYRYGGGWKQDAETHPSILFGAGFLISTPFDMALFITALFNHQLISKEHLAVMKNMQDGEGSGMEPFIFSGKTFLGHTGGADNYGAWLAYLPEEKLAVAYTTNAKVYPVGDIMQNAIDIYYGNKFEIPEFKTIVVDENLLEKYSGVYSAPPAPVKFTITRKAGILYIQPPGETSTPLEAVSQTTFRIEGRNEISFEFDAEKKQMIMHRPGLERTFIKE